MVYTRRDYRQLVRGHLEASAVPMTDRFRSLFKKALHPDVRVVDIEVFPDGVPPDARIFLMDGRNDEVFGGPEGPLTSSLDLLPGVDLYQNEEGRPYEFEATGFDAFDINVGETVAWLARCWERGRRGLARRPGLHLTPRRHTCFQPAQGTLDKRRGGQRSVVPRLNHRAGRGQNGSGVSETNDVGGLSSWSVCAFAVPKFRARSG